MAESSSVFDADPTVMAPSQRIAQAHAASNNEVPLQSESDVSSHEPPKAETFQNDAPGAKQMNGHSRDVDLKDEVAFPTLGGSNTTKPKSLWGSMRPLKSVVTTPSQVLSASDMVTETVTLEVGQQQARTLGKSQAGVVVTTVQKTTNTTIQMSIAQKTGTTTFLIKGKPAAVQTARRSLLKELGKKVVLKILVPSGVRPYIIGAKGRTLKAIVDRTGARIQLPKRDDSLANGAPDPEEMVEITIEGDFDGANSARKEIDAIVAERTSTTSIKISSIPLDYYGLLSLQVRVLENDQDLKIKIPSSSFTEDLPSPITLTGEKSAVAEAKDRMEAAFEELRRVTIPTSFPVAKKQHKFVAAAVSEILSSTGCSVIVPPVSSTSDHITIRGPAANIGAGITLVMDKAKSMAIDSLEISRAHASAPDQLQHAVDITNYLRNANQLRELERNHSVSITTPSETELLSATKVVLDISGKSQLEVSEARKAIINLINSLPPSKVRRLEVEQLLHKQVMGVKGKNVATIRKQHGVEITFPAMDLDNSNVVLVYCGSEHDTSQITSAMADAESALSAIVSSAGTVTTEIITIPAKHHGTIAGKNNTTLNAITGGSDAVVRVLLGQPDSNAITIKGPKVEVARVAKDIQQVVEQAENSEAANAYKLEFDFPAQFTKNLIGKGGSNISKIRDELGVRIDVGDEGKIICQGPQRNVEEAKSRITLLGDRLADETTFKLKIPAEFHGQIIGQGGKFVKRLEDKYQVQINFPKTGEGDEADERLGKNEVLIKGGKKGATAARAEVMELFEYENEHSYSTTVQVLQRAVAQIVGKAGIAINELKDETNTRIDIEKDAPIGDSPEALVSITITGKKSQVETAKSALLRVNEEVEDTVTRTLVVDPAYHRTLIGPGGSNIRELVVKAGGPEDPALRTRMVRFPRAGDNSSDIVLKGPKKIVDKIAKAIEKIVGGTENQHSRVIMVPKEQVRLIIGRGGSKKQEMESKFSVMIDIPRNDSAAESDISVKVLGAEEDITEAIAEITKLIRIPDSETVQVPRKLHTQVADNGAFIRRLRVDYKVAIDHDGHNLPKPRKLEAPEPSNARIDDEPQENGDSVWSVVESSSNEEGNIPWVFKGDSSQIAKAKKALASAVAQASTQTHVGYLSVPTAKHRYIIGQGGSKINAIREASGTKIDVPRNHGDEVVVIKGSLEGLEKAKAMIIEATTASAPKRRDY